MEIMFPRRDTSSQLRSSSEKGDPAVTPSCPDIRKKLKSPWASGLSKAMQDQTPEMLTSGNELGTIILRDPLKITKEIT